MQLFMADQIASQSDYLGITEAAEYLRVSASTLRRWEKKGFLIPERTPTGIRRYTKQQLDAVLQQGPQLLADEGQTSYDQALPPQQYEQSVTSYEQEYVTETKTYAEEEVPMVQEYSSPQPIPVEPADQNSFISSHRYTPPPAYAQQPTYTPQQQYTPPPPPPMQSTSASSAFNKQSYSPVKMPEDDIQSSLNELSHTVSHSQFNRPSHHMPEETYHESVSNDLQPAYQKTETFPTSYADDFAFEEEDADEPVIAHSMLEQNFPAKNAVSKKKSSAGGFAMFLGVFVGIILITASIWLGFMYFSGNLGTAGLLSPVP